MKTQQPLEDGKVDVKLKLAALWGSFMLLYIYVDHLQFFMPHSLEGILKGIVFKFDITPAFLMIAMVTATIPALMIVLSVLLPSQLNRLFNISIALLYIPYMLFNLAGEVWMHMVFAAIVEVALLFMIIYYAWKWPRTEA